LSVVTVGPKESVCGKLLVVDVLLLAGYYLSFFTFEYYIISSDPLLRKILVPWLISGVYF